VALDLAGVALMPKPTNDEFVKRHKQLGENVIATCSKSAADKITLLKKPTVNEIAAIIANEFKNSTI
jgi:hypothetical protein